MTIDRRSIMKVIGLASVTNIMPASSLALAPSPLPPTDRRAIISAVSGYPMSFLFGVSDYWHLASFSTSLPVRILKKNDIEKLQLWLRKQFECSENNYCPKKPDKEWSFETINEYTKYIVENLNDVNGRVIRCNKVLSQLIAKKAAYFGSPVRRAHTFNGGNQHCVARHPDLIEGQYEDLEFYSRNVISLALLDMIDCSLRNPNATVLFDIYETCLIALNNVVRVDALDYLLTLPIVKKYGIDRLNVFANNKALDAELTAQFKEICHPNFQVNLPQSKARHISVVSAATLHDEMLLTRASTIIGRHFLRRIGELKPDESVLQDSKIHQLTSSILQISAAAESILTNSEFPVLHDLVPRRGVSQFEYESDGVEILMKNSVFLSGEPKWED